jgi:hypothetical protein
MFAMAKIPALALPATRPRTTAQMATDGDARNKKRQSCRNSFMSARALWSRKKPTGIEISEVGLDESGIDRRADDRRIFQSIQHILAIESGAGFA